MSILLASCSTLYCLCIWYILTSLISSHLIAIHGGPLYLIGGSPGSCFFWFQGQHSHQIVLSQTVVKYRVTTYMYINIFTLKNLSVSLKCSKYAFHVFKNMHNVCCFIHLHPQNTCIKQEFIFCSLHKAKKNICVLPVSRPTLIFRATLNILLHF